MALTYRSPIEDVVGSFEPSYQTAIASTAAMQYKEMEADNFQYFNYALNAEAKKHLIGAGIYLSPYSAVPHSHACCKTLENYMLYKALPSYLDNSFFFVGIKNFKLAILKKREKNLDLITAINRYVTSADRLRYSNDFVVRHSESHKALESHAKNFKAAPLRDLVPALMRRSAKKLFLHDEIHYWSPQDLGEFLDAVEPETVIATMVYPPELLVGSPSSLHPWCYTYTVEGSTLRYYPDGVQSEGYEQPVKGGFLLRSSTFTTQRGSVYCVDLLCSKFSHHLLAITRGKSITPTQRSFGPFQATDMTGLGTITPKHRVFYPIQVEVVSRLYRYLRSLKKPDAQSAMAKLSQMVPEPTGAEIKFVQEFCDLVLSCKPLSTGIAPMRLTEFAGNLLGHLPGCLAERFRQVKEVSLDKFIAELKPFTAKVKLMNTCAQSHFDIALLPEIGESSMHELPTLMEDKFMGAPAVPQRQRAPYVGRFAGPNEVGATKEPLIVHIENPSKLLRIITKLVVQSHVTRKTGECDVDAAIEKLVWCARKSVVFRGMLMAISGNGDALQGMKKVMSEVMRPTIYKERSYATHGVAWFSHPRRGVTLCIEGPAAGPRDAHWGVPFGSMIAERLSLGRKWQKFLHKEQGVVPVENTEVKPERGGANEGNAVYTAGCEPKIVEIDSEPLPHDIGDSSTDEMSVEFPADDIEEERAVMIEFPGGSYTRGMSMPVIEYTTKSVPADGDCFWHCIGEALRMEPREMRRACRVVDLGSASLNASLHRQLEQGVWAEDESIMASAVKFNLRIEILEPATGLKHVCTSNAASAVIPLQLHSEHFEIVLPKNGCLIHAVCKAMNRTTGEVLKVLEDEVDEVLVHELWEGEGLTHLHMEVIFKTFGICARVEEDGHYTEYNSEGRTHKDFRLKDGHIEHIGRQGLAPTKLLSKAAYSRAITSKSVEIMSKAGTALQYQCEWKRAKMLADSLHEGSTGVISSKLFNDKAHLLDGVDVKDGVALPCHAILGTFGAGKSTLFKQFMRVNLGKCVTYVSPRKALAEAFKQDVLGRGKSKAGQEHWRIVTYEKFLGKARSLLTGQALILDEVQLYPPGYIDLVGMLVPQGVHCFLVGDPCQSDYDNENDRGRFIGVVSDVDKLLKGQVYKFVIGSRRFNNGNFKNRLPCDLLNIAATEREEPYEIREGVDVLHHMDEKWLSVVLVSSFDEKKIVSTYAGPDVKCLTFGESTGLNFKRGTVLVTRASEHASEKRWLTALSRFSENLCIVNACGLSMDALVITYKRRALGRFLTGTASEKDLYEHLPGKAQMVQVFSETVGKDEGLREEKLVGDPWLKTMINLAQTVDMQDVEEALEIVEDENFKTHLPQCELEGLRARWVERIKLKERREVRLGNIVSEQFTDEYPKTAGKVLTNAAERFETIYPRHRANDSVTFIMAVKKRLRFSKPMVERAKLQQAENYGRYLRDIFLNEVPLKAAHNHQMMEAALHEFEEKKCSKSAATIENHSNRSCRDWLADVAMIFSKSQLCTKFDNRFRDAKAAQSIVCFQHSVLCRFAPYMRYIEKKLHEAMPKRFYVHSGKGLEVLNSWVKEGKFEGVCTESDYEAFDASQDQYIVAFELAIMRHLGLPNDLIEDYKFIKTHLGSKLGSFAIMRFSGEASTFLFNTMANMLFTFMRYELRGDEYICFAGDDMCSSKRLRIKYDHEKFLGKLKLKAKVQHVSTPTFCGWNLSPHGIYKKPQLVLERMCIAKELNNLPNCIDNYAIEVGYAYRLGEKALERMDEEEVEAFYNCVRVIIKNKHHLKSDIADLFRDESEA